MKIFRHNLFWAFVHPLKFAKLLVRLVNDKTCSFQVRTFTIYSSTTLENYDLESYYFGVNPACEI